MEHIINIDRELCIGCALCAQDCPSNMIYIANQKAEIKGQDCMKCGHCVAVCPKGAVSMGGFDEPPVEIKEPVILEPSQLLRALQTRRSIRRFQSREISDEVVAQIIEAGRFTPRGRNLNNVSYIVLKEEKDRAESLAVRFFNKLRPLAALFSKDAKNVAIDEHFFFKKAPVALMIVTDGGAETINGALAAADMALMAEAHGLGVLYSGLFTMAVNHHKKLRKQLGLTHKQRVATTLVLGYPDIKYRRTAQRESAKVRRM